ncbi:hypothetical protein NLJ89_g11114 [Agrocybe chaxingu]|uniref:Uncharacterized protein n=1 Tax=Agrocybe chaxingu TaxID=84603 RepID=A0A9W8JQJ1_9AGAR|nr:hypothetical protein NLJ89_g11114 [Agrocybe chaxingu]
MLGPRSMGTGHMDTGAGTQGYSSNLGSAGPGGYETEWDGGGEGGGGTQGMIGNGVGGGGDGGGVWADGGGGGGGEYGGGADLHHRTSAKRLIDRYERLSTPPPRTGTGPNAPLRQKSTRSYQYVYDYRAEAGHSNYLAMPERGLGSDSKFKQKYGLGDATGAGRKDTQKDRSPIRQSLRSLLSVFKKGAGGLAKRKSEDKDFAGGSRRRK